MAKDPNDPNDPNAPSADGRSRYHREAAKATAAYRIKHAMPEGAQVQHWNKVLDAEKHGMSIPDMNKNLSTLQSRTDRAATTLHVSPTGKGTRYTVHERVLVVNDDRKNINPKDVNRDLSEPKRTYGTEHKFADRYLIKSEFDKLQNTNLSGRDKVELAGATARWKMTGDPGPRSPHLFQKLDIARGERFRPPAPEGSNAPTRSDIVPRAAANRTTGSPASGNNNADVPRPAQSRPASAGASAGRASTANRASASPPAGKPGGGAPRSGSPAGTPGGASTNPVSRGLSSPSIGRVAHGSSPMGPKIGPANPSNTPSTT